MPEIGATLREARMRQRIDISDVEAQTKIRAKYLRALENEEWDLLPGPTFVKTFLRTYAESLGLDARLLLEEYKLRFERLTDHELLPITPPTARERRGRRGPGIGRDVLVAVVLVALVALLIVLGRDSSSNNSGTTAATTPRTAPTAASTGDGHRRRRTTAAATASTVRLRLDPTGDVYVCLKAAGKVLIREQVLTPSTPPHTYRAKAFRILLGNGALTMRIDGRTRSVPKVSKPIAYAITPKGRRTIPADVATICA